MDLAPLRIGPIFERAVVDVFGDQVLASFALARIVNSNNVRMIQRRCCPRLALEPPAGGSIGEFVRQHSFEPSANDMEFYLKRSRKVRFTQITRFIYRWS